jgi:hypothetical protein
MNKIQEEVLTSIIEVHSQADKGEYQMNNDGKKMDKF